MGEKTGIQWCDATATPVIGCWPVSPGCAQCWARQDTPARVLRAGKWPGHPEPFETWTKEGPRYRVKGFADTMQRLNARPWVCDECGAAKAGRTPLGDFKPCECGSVKFHRRRVFIGDSCDLLDPAWPIEWLAETLEVMWRCPDLTQILCTKRPELWRERFDLAQMRVARLGRFVESDWLARWLHGQPPRNVCVLTSVESQEQEARVKDLLQIPARWRGLSLEPLLAPVWLPPLVGLDFKRNMPSATPCADGHGIDWLIIGCESLRGKAGRFASGYVDAADSLIRQGRAAGVAVFHKQMPVGGKVSGDPQEWEVNLGVREWPEGMRME